MMKKSIGLAMSGLLLAVFTGYGAGCTTTTTTTVTENDGGTGGPNPDGGEVPPDGDGPECYDPSVRSVPYKAPFQNAGACSEEQLLAFEACFDRAGGGQCTEFIRDPANADCYSGCLLVDPTTASNVGAYYLGARNLPGFVRMHGASEACAQAYHASLYCGFERCFTCEPESDAETACLEYADAPGGPCEEKYEATAQACNLPEDQAALDALQPYLNDRIGFNRLFCGTAGDAGL